jgi:mismatch-specific thymine-DNA glycosylase
MDEPLRDILVPGLLVLLVGYNPGRYSWERGHHFAGPGNDFWPLLYESGLTGRRLTWQDDHELPVWGLGVCNLVDRMTPSSQDLSREEQREGGWRLRQKVWQLRPRVVCCLGKDVYRGYALRRPRDPVAWGRQPHGIVEGVWDVVAPNPSRRSTVPYATRLAVLHQVAELVRTAP